MLNEDAGWIDSRTKSAPGARLPARLMSVMLLFLLLCGRFQVGGGRVGKERGGGGGRKKGVVSQYTDNGAGRAQARWTFWACSRISLP